MWAKLLIGAAAGFFVPVAGFVVGWVVGADVGGNSMVDFEFGMRGYEATGLIGGGIGAAFGGLLGVVLVLLVSSRRGSR